MIVDRYDGVLPWSMPASAPARKRSTRSSRSSWLPDEEQLAERPRVEREGHLVGDGLVARVGPATRAGPGHEGRRVGGTGHDPLAEGEPGGGVGVPGEAEGRDAGARLGGQPGLDLRGGQDLGQRVEVVADADPALGERLERRGAAARERVEHDVAGPAVAGDERVGEGRREAREVRAHRVEAVAPQPRLELPVRLDRDRREGTGQLEGELARVRILVGHSRGSTTPRGWAPA